MIYKRRTVFIPQMFGINYIWHIILMLLMLLFLFLLFCLKRLGLGTIKKVICFCHVREIKKSCVQDKFFICVKISIYWVTKEMIRVKCMFFEFVWFERYLMLLLLSPKYIFKYVFSWIVYGCRDKWHKRRYQTLNLIIERNIFFCHDTNLCMTSEYIFNRPECSCLARIYNSFGIKGKEYKRTTFYETS